MDKYKLCFAIVVVLVVGCLQAYAWYLGKNGTVWAFTSLIIGLVAGAVFGFTVSVKKSIGEYIEKTKTKDN